ncbi:MAG: hypothetical protein KDC42_03290 [Ignavibacteriae bacterium]|nr:hypothetical protein [Ignavibacteriota bacterium]
MQLIPSPVFFQDQNEDNARVIFGLRWQVTPINIAFKTNKYVSPVQFFMINPVRRFTGSVEMFVQPEWTTTGFRYSNLNRFGISIGSRVILPIQGEGENLSASIGGKYNYREDFYSDKNSYLGVETGLYFFYGLMGVQFNYNFDSKTKYNIGLYIKYF